ncbi:MAG TPA: FecR domain-containing protein [Pyrinomonadaceae bacterium]|nr:FecR domain-containing protein [Pyrinomonadaceae bacterium]
MNEKHYKEKLSEFVNHELANDERQEIGEHLLVCVECRAEHDEIKLGAALASQLNQHNAPENLWRKIENALDKKEEKAFPLFAFFGSRAFAAAFGLLVICGLFATVYFGFLRNNSLEIVKDEKPVSVETPQVIPTLNETATNQISNRIIAENNNSNIQTTPQTTNSDIQILPKVSTTQPKETIISQTNLPSWNVETLAGMPKIGNSFNNEKLIVGEFLVTDANSRAKIQVADIGNVEIAPNSRVKLVKTKSTEHRLSLEKGLMKAKIDAPPRLFIVDTPSAVAVDLGCEYTLEVDKNGNSRLQVTTGFVALENGKLSSIVPAGAIALTRKGKGIGTPFAEDSSAELQSALYKFDFQNGGNSALETIIKEANLYDSLTLWHLLSRVPKTERGKVFNALANLVEPSANVTVEGILRLDKKMLDAWWKEVENVWFE